MIVDDAWKVLKCFLDRRVTRKGIYCFYCLVAAPEDMEELKARFPHQVIALGAVASLHI